MIWLNFSHWNTSHGPLYVQRRVRIAGRWTPLVTLHRKAPYMKPEKFERFNPARFFIAWGIVAAVTLALLFLSGCGTAFENRVTCTPDGKAYLVSKYGGVGVASELSDKDAAIICAK